MIKVERTNSQNRDFQQLIVLLDKELNERNGIDQEFYDQFNKVDSIKNVLVLYEDDFPVACGAYKTFNEYTVEIKRMYVVKSKRNRGFAKTILSELEQWAEENNFFRTILETGKMQTEALHLYQKNGYNIIPNYGQYAGIENSVCFEKKLNSF
jgi:putative acetyltransferase